MECWHKSDCCWVVVNLATLSSWGYYQISNIGGCLTVNVIFFFLVKEESSDMASHRRKKKRRVVRKDQEPSPIHLAVDPNEPTYCLCNQVSYGDMIGCDNVDCEVEWFHFNCVQLTHKPKGKWYCPRCRGERPNVPLKRTDK